MTSVDSYKAQFKELARNNRFNLRGPAAPPKPELCISAQVPSVSVATLESRSGVHTAPVKVPYDSILSEMVLSFNDDESMTNRNYYEEWFQEVISVDGFGYYNDFKRSSLNIEQLDRAGQVIKSWTLIDLYPINLSEISFDQSAQNTLTTFSVTLAYHDADWIG